MVYSISIAHLHRQMSSKGLHTLNLLTHSSSSGVAQQRPDASTSDHHQASSTCMLLVTRVHGSEPPPSPPPRFHFSVASFINTNSNTFFRYDGPFTMSDSELQDLLQSGDDEVFDSLTTVDQFLCNLEEEDATAQPTIVPTVRWKKRGSDGSLICTRPRSSRQQHPEASCSQLPQADSAPARAEVVFAPESVEEFLNELQHTLCDDAAVEMEEDLRCPQASASWSLRKSLFSENWRAERPHFVNTMMAKENVVSRTCQECRSESAVIRCRDCRPRPFLCSGCDRSVHNRHPLHNRDATIAGFYQPLPPTKFISSGALCHCDCLVPLEIPTSICGCSNSLKVKPGKVVAVVTMNGRYDLNIFEVVCGSCNASWSPGINDILGSDFWPATLNFCTLFATDIFSTYEDLKMAAPGLSCQAFLRMLDQRTVRFGRMGKISPDAFSKSFLEWEAVKYKMDKYWNEEPFTCPACSPEMLAVSVDGNRKHYRFKTAARSEEQPVFDNVFLAKDDDVTAFVDYIHSKTKHVSGRGICSGEWSAARETARKSASKVDEEGLELAVCRHGVAKHCPELQVLLNMKPFLSVFHAKAHDFKCEFLSCGCQTGQMEWRISGGAGLTLGEEVEQVNAFLSRIAVTTKHMSKAGRSDMLTILVLQISEKKTSVFSATKTLEKKEQMLESTKTALSLSDIQIEEWVTDVKEWAEVTPPSTDEHTALRSKIEALVPSIKRHMQRLYKVTDSSKARDRLRRKIRQEKQLLSSVVAQYNSVMPSTEPLCIDIILSEDVAWPWQEIQQDSVDIRTKRQVFDQFMAVKRLQEELKILVAEMAKHWKYLLARSDWLKEQCDLLHEQNTQDPLKNLPGLLKKKKWDIRQKIQNVKHIYLNILTGTESNFLQTTSDFSDIGSDTSEDEM
ncbi:hypothetical protein WMY93_014845 [Mugilogobius chulae]|uniref:CxC3 like cysteine cluster domain-containing protein n=1 Tax=Mugilogobius chulae TaxID=88201 RepID=A0AAW0P048_9GOBI